VIAYDKTDLSSALEVCIEDDALYKWTYTLLYLWLRVCLSVHHKLAFSIEMAI